MNKKLIGILVCILILTISGFSVTGNTPEKNQNKTNSYNRIETTLITRGSTLYEIDSNCNIIWNYTTGFHFSDAERLSNGNTLIAESGNNRIIEIDGSGTIIWSYSTGLDHPIDVERLTNGNTLITDWNNRVIEVDSSGTIIWSYSTGLNQPFDAERLNNDNTLIADWVNDRVIEVDSSGTIIWSYSEGLSYPCDVERLSNGNTLISNQGGDVIEVDNSGTIVWECGLNHLFDAERLPNGNTLMTSDIGSTYEKNSSCGIVWQCGPGGDDVERIFINQPPDAPIITGPNNGKPNTEYEFTVIATDPDGDDVRFIVDWGDGDNETTPYTASGSDLDVSHIWTDEGTFTITVYAEDEFGAVSGETTSQMIIEKSKTMSHPFINFLQSHPNMFPILQQLIQRLGLQ